MTPPALYGPLRTVIRLLLGAFFRRVRTTCEENLPVEGPVLLVGNHPNSLLDPAALIAVCERPVAFAAKDVLFANPLLRPILRGVGAVSIRRRVEADGKVDAATSDAPARVDNSEAFAAMQQRLAAGGAIGIFPEGLSHDEAQLQPLRTGAARLALTMPIGSPPLTIVPVGLNYSAPKRFRSNVLVRFGPPLCIDDARRAAATEDPRAAARALTHDIDLALRALTINADDWDTLRVLETVRRLYQPPGLSLEARVELAQRFAAGYAAVRDQPDIHRLFEAVAHFRDRLDAIDLQERDLDHDWALPAVVARFFRRSGRALFWLPLALPGLLLHLPAALLAGVVGRFATPRRDVVATTKLLVGFALVALTWVVAGSWLYPTLGRAPFSWSPWLRAALLPLLPLSGWAALRVVERYADGRELLASLLSYFRYRREVADLRREARLLESAVVRAVVRHLPADLEPLFLQASAERIGNLGDDVLPHSADRRDGEVAAAAMDAAGVPQEESLRWLAAFDELLKENR